MRRALGSLACLVALGVGWAACLPTREEGDTRRLADRQDGGEGATIVGQDGGTPTSDGGDPGDDPHAVAGVDPSHGPFNGGQRVVISGNGFSFKPRVWFGDTEVDAADVVAISQKKIQVNVPPGKPGDVDVRVQAGSDTSTARVLSKAYTYDPFYVEPSTGPTSGGTIVTVHGQGTTWGPGVSVRVGGKECGSLTASATTLTCTTPASTPGAKPVVVTLADGTSATVLDAFTYADSDDGFKGGLSGDKLAGKVRVLAFDGYTGMPLEGATVLVGDTMATALKGKIDANGVALIQDASLTAPVTVTVARKCSQPTTFVAVPVDTVTMYLDPVISPACSPPEGDPPPVGGKPGLGAAATGEIVFNSGPEFKRGPWTNVPAPVGPNEKRVAYLFYGTNDPRQPFVLPAAGSGITEDAPGSLGYGFSASAPIGNIAAYVLVGIEDRSANPAKFTAYGFGVTKGISTKPGQSAKDIVIPITHTLDQAVTVALSPPEPGKTGPDRVQTSVAVSLGNYGFAIFPGAQKTSFLPLAGNLPFVGLPSLTNNLAGSTYVTSALAGTGASVTLPVSVVGKVATTSASQVVTIDGFVGVPTLSSPDPGSTWDGSTYAITQSKGVPADVFVLDVQSGGGLVGWLIAAPGDHPSFKVPDLRKLSAGGLVPGPISVRVSAGFVLTDDAAGGGKFDYGKLRYRHLAPRGWTAYAQDAFYAALPP